MAAYKPSDAITFAKKFIKDMPLDDTSVSYQITDYVASLMWAAAPWRWTVGTLSTVNVVAGTTDYTVSPPADFLYLNKAILSDGSLSNELKIVSALPATITQVGVPSQVAYLDTLNLLRVSPKPTASFNQTLTMLYKKQPPKITSSNYGTAGVLVFPDVYYPAFQAGVLWQAYLYADDDRAGTVTVDGEGKRQYTQQHGAFEAALAEMRQAEKLPLSFPQVPESHG